MAEAMSNIASMFHVLCFVFWTGNRFPSAPSGRTCMLLLHYYYSIVIVLLQYYYGIVIVLLQYCYSIITFSTRFFLKV